MENQNKGKYNIIENMGITVDYIYDMKSLKNIISRIESEIESKKDRIEGLKASKESEIKDKNAEIEKLQNKINIALPNSPVRKVCEQKIEVLNNEIEDIKNKYDTQIKELNSEINQNGADKNGFKKDIEYIKDGIKEELKAKLEKEKNSYKLSEEIEKEKEDIKTEIEAINVSIESAKKSIEMCNAVIEENENIVKEITQKIIGGIASQEEIDRLHSLNTHIKFNRAAIYSAENEIKSSEEKLEDLKTRKTDYKSIDDNLEIYLGFENMQIILDNQNKFNEFLSKIEEVVEEIDKEEMITEEVPIEEAPIEEAPTEEAPTEEVPTEEVPTEEIATEEASVEEENSVEQIKQEIVDEFETFSRNLEYESKLTKFKQKFNISTDDYEKYDIEIKHNLKNGIKKEDYIKELKASNPNIREKEVEMVSNLWDIIGKFDNPKEEVIEDVLENVSEDLESDEKLTEIHIDEKTEQSFDDILKNLGFEIPIPSIDKSEIEEVSNDVIKFEDSTPIIDLDSEDYIEVITSPNEMINDDEDREENEFIKQEIDTENIPSLYFKFLENMSKCKAINDIKEYLDTEFKETMKLTGKKTLRQKFNDFKMRYEHRRRQGESIFSSVRKIEYSSLKSNETDKIKAEIEEDLTRLQEGKPVQTSVVKKYLRDARDDMAITLNEYKFCKYESGLYVYDKKINLLEDYEKIINDFNEDNEGFTIVFAKGESYVDENGKFCKVKNKNGEKHFVKYESILQQLQETKKEVAQEKIIAKKDMEREESLGK